MASSVESGSLRSAIDMDRRPLRQESSKRYIAYLNEWEARRRLKKSVKGPPDNRQDASAINGKRVPRKGKGIQPVADKEEQPWDGSGAKKIVEGMSYASCTKLLEALESGELPPLQPCLTADEMRPHFARRVTHRFNVSQLVGSGAIVAEQAEPKHKPSRAPGSANPGYGLSPRMTKTLSYSAEPDEDSPSPRQSLSWMATPRVDTTDSIIWHRHSDSGAAPKPAKLGERLPTPATRSVDLSESRKCFMSSLNEYAFNRVKAMHGDFHVRAAASTCQQRAGAAGVRTLVGL